jgi:FkbM family methyltransferase
MSCGQSADEQVNQRAREFYMKNQITTTDDDQLETIELRKASTVLADILKKHPNKSVMLKMDCEGSEYAVFRDLEETGLLGSFRFVMLEWHYQGSRALEEALERTGYSFWSKAKSSDMGLIYACKG